MVIVARLIISDARWGCLDEVGLPRNVVLQREQSGRKMTLSLLVDIIYFALAVIACDGA